MGINDVTAWARKRLAEGGKCTAPAALRLPADEGPHASSLPGAKDDGEAPDWRALDKAYLMHHTRCPVCQAAGRGARYGLRCGAGASLWNAYTDAVMVPGALPWQKQNGQPRT